MFEEMSEEEILEVLLPIAEEVCGLIPDGFSCADEVFCTFRYDCQDMREITSAGLCLMIGTFSVNLGGNDYVEEMAGEDIQDLGEDEVLETLLPLADAFCDVTTEILSCAEDSCGRLSWPAPNNDTTS